MALIPLKDDNPLRRIGFQYMTVALMAVCTAVFLWQLSLGGAEGQAVFGFGTIPSVLFGARELAPDLVMVPAPVTLLTSLFLHGGWMHLIGNMLFLWVFGDNVEDAMGHVRFLAFYLVCGVVAGLAHSVLHADSTAPLIGASGAVSGVLGAYLVLHPKARVLVLVSYFPVRLPAVVVLGGWIALQLFNASLGGAAGAGGIAWWAHIGGVVAGALLVVPMRRRGVPLFDGGGQPGEAAPPRAAGKRSRLPDSGRRDG